MKTASHSTYQGPGRIVISLGRPRHSPAGYRIYKKLAPTGDMLRMPYDQYREKFFVLLSQLDAQKVHDELQALAGEGVEPVLQCFEKPPFNANNWCHRRMVAEWFEQQLGIKVPEIGYDGPDR